VLILDLLQALGSILACNVKLTFSSAILVEFQQFAKKKSSVYALVHLGLCYWESATNCFSFAAPRNKECNPETTKKPRKQTFFNPDNPGFMNFFTAKNPSIFGVEF
jgi:hypothetical protein